MYRLLHPGAAAGAVHAEGEGQLQVQAVAGGGVQPLRVLHHAPHRPQHHPPHDEGRATWTPTPQGCLYLGPSPSDLDNSVFAESVLTSYNFLAS